MDSEDCAGAKTGDPRISRLPGSLKNQGSGDGDSEGLAGFHVVPFLKGSGVDEGSASGAEGNQQSWPVLRNLFWDEDPPVLVPEVDDGSDDSFLADGALDEEQRILGHLVALRIRV
jgi:hypothetical protein